MTFIKTFKQLGKGDAEIAGGKGASLGEMSNAGIPVPPGFVVLSGAFDYFLEQAGIKADIDSLLAQVNHKDVNSVENTSGEIQAIIKSAQMPEEIATEINEHYQFLTTDYGQPITDLLVAVRSSATAEDSSDASWAGELDSFLNTTKETLFENIKNCWASLFTPRAIFYRIEKNMHNAAVSVAVVVQKMIQSEVSGICFTVHPVTEDRDQMVIEAGWGLGEAIVGGMITPDNYVIRKSEILNSKSEKNSKFKIPNAKTNNPNSTFHIKHSNEIITEKYISEQEMKIVRGPEGTKEVEVARDEWEKQKLSDEKIVELAEICLGIEKHYGFPCDIEWAAAPKGQSKSPKVRKSKSRENVKLELYIVQSRPITTLSQ